MIPQTMVIRMLNRERIKLKRDDLVSMEFLAGFIAAVNLAITLIRETAKETKQRLKNNPKFAASLIRATR